MHSELTGMQGDITSINHRLDHVGDRLTRIEKRLDLITA